MAMRGKNTAIRNSILFLMSKMVPRHQLKKIWWFLLSLALAARAIYVIKIAFMQGFKPSLS